MLSSWSSFCLLREELAATSVYWNYLLPSTCDEDLNAPFSRRTSCVMDHCVFVISWTLEDLKSNFPNSTDMIIPDVKSNNAGKCAELWYLLYLSSNFTPNPTININDA